MALERYMVSEIRWKRKRLTRSSPLDELMWRPRTILATSTLSCFIHLYNELIMWYSYCIQVNNLLPTIKWQKQCSKIETSTLKWDTFRQNFYIISNPFKLTLSCPSCNQARYWTRQNAAKYSSNFIGGFTEKAPFYSLCLSHRHPGHDAKLQSHRVIIQRVRDLAWCSYKGANVIMSDR